MSAPVPIEPDSDAVETTSLPVEETPAVRGQHLDPITGEPHAHPVGVGVGALGAGAAGAAIGMIGGPIGMLVGAAIGAIAGGLAGHEVADEPEVSSTSGEAAPLDSFDHTTTAKSEAADELPLSSTLAQRTNPADDTFFTSGIVSGLAPVGGETALDDFDRPHAAAAPVAPTAAVFEDDKPLPTASSGLVTPDESSFFADSSTGESSVMTESPFSAARAVNAEGSASFTPQLAVEAASTSPTTLTEIPAASAAASTGAVSHPDMEHTVRTGAYYRYLSREATGQAGSDFEDWIEAEKEVVTR